MTEVPPRRIGGRCPLCGRPSEPATRPFCSRRCSDIDLARWFGGAYAVPARDDDDETRPGGTEEE